MKPNQQTEKETVNNQRIPFTDPSTGRRQSKLDKAVATIEGNVTAIQGDALPSTKRCDREFFGDRLNVAN